MEPAGLYVHIPFCSAICPYCDFAVLRDDASKRRRYVAALIGEARLAQGASWPPFETVYFGGGTPSALTSDEFRDLAARLRAELPISGDAAWHLEVNPEDVDAARIEAWREEGIVFISLGIQSFDDDELKFLGRRHDGARAQAALDAVLAAGFETVSLDLIYGLPGREVRDFRKNLEIAASFPVGHLSAYQLTIHEGTPFHRRREGGGLVEVDLDLQADLFLAAVEVLGPAGLSPYEISNFSRGERHQSRHNRKYWRREPYLGLGLGAHSFDGRKRFWNVRDFDAYCDRLERGVSSCEEEEVLSREDQRLEWLMLAMRTVDGLDLDRFQSETGCDLSVERADVLRRRQESADLVVEGGNLMPTIQGLLIADTLARELS